MNENSICKYCGSELTTIPLDGVPEREILALAKEAHRRDITLNQLIVGVLVEASKKTIDEHGQNLAADKNLIDAINEIGE